MKEVRWFSLLITLVAACLFLAACTPLGPANGTNSPGTSPQSQGPSTSLSPYSGWVDFRDCQEVRGWVWKGTAPETTVKVELYVDDKLIETLAAETPRPDLVNKLGTGRYGFTFKMPSVYKDSKSHTVKIKVADGDYTLPFYQGVPASLECKP